jgi:hypothetical protein
MISRPLAIGVLAAGLTAAAGGAYLAGRHSAGTRQSAPDALPAAAPAPPAANETESVVTPAEDRREPPAAREPIEAQPPAKVPPVERRVFPRAQLPRRPAPARAASEPSSPAPGSRIGVEPAPNGRVVSSGATPDLPQAPQRSVAGEPASEPSAAAGAAWPPSEAARPAAATRPTEPTFEEVVLPASSVIGLELETNVTSERARLEDRVDARVTRDVYADGRLAIPAGSRVTGAVTMVERGGKMKERARLGVRFHTLVLANGRQVSLRTETIYREGDPPSSESSKKIGGAAIGGAVLGAILGGGKGAIAGATAGAAGGTAAVMAGGRNPATLASGSVVTVKLSAPASFEADR